MPYTNDKRPKFGFDEYVIPEFDKITTERPVLNRGDVVWFITKKKNNYLVDVGLVYDDYDNAVCIQLVEFRDLRKVNGIPYKDFPWQTAWRKLPHGYDSTYQLTSLCKFSIDEVSPEEAAFRRNYVNHTAQEIQEAFDRGWLVKIRDNDHSHLEAIVDADYGWMLQKTGEETEKPYLCGVSHDYIALEHQRVFLSYEEARSRVDAYEAKIMEQINMSEHDWNVKMARVEVERWGSFRNDNSEETLQKAMDFLVSQKNFDELEVEAVCGDLKYRKFGNKTWSHYKC